MSEHTPDPDSGLPAPHESGSDRPAPQDPPADARSGPSGSPADTRSLSKEVEIEAPAEAVWKALTEAEELVRWFPLEARVEPGEGGTIWLSWGEGAEGEARIETWEPGRRFAWIQGETMVVDFTIEGEGGRSVVRLVQSGFSAEAEWDDYYDATDAGWTFFLNNLKHYLERHPGSASEIVHARRASSRIREEAWAALVGSDGLAPEPPLETDPGAGRGGATVGEARGAGPAEAHSVRLGEERHELRPWMVRPGRAMAGRLPDLGDATLIVEMEPGSAEEWHCGFWLYVWEPSGERTESLQRGLDELADRVTGSERET